MEIELGTNENMLGDENLHPGAKVDIEMIRGAYWLILGGTNSGADTAALIK
jgi:hypothetical protein